MRTVVALSLLALALAFAPAFAQDKEDESSAAAARVAQLDFLAGDWAGSMWGGRFEAYYTTPDGGRVISHSRLLRGEPATESFYEFEMFHVVGGDVRMSPFPGGQRAVELTLVDLDPVARKATFENPDKDYPTRIVYHRETDEDLVITLSDPHGGSAKVERFALRRED